jgi:hypothetical protein
MTSKWCGSVGAGSAFGSPEKEKLTIRMLTSSSYDVRKG